MRKRRRKKRRKEKKKRKMKRRIRRKKRRNKLKERKRHQMNIKRKVCKTQLPPSSPPHATITPAKIIKIKDVIDTPCQNINPLTAKDLTKILDQSTQAARLCSSPILVSVDELQKSVVDPKEVKVKTQEPPLTTKTTELLLLPPPSPPKVIIDVL